MPVRPNLLERLAMYRLKIAPLPLLDVFGAFSFRVLVTGLRLGLFDALGRPRSVESLSRELGVEEGTAQVLLEALAAVGYVEEKPEGWVNTSATARWLAVDDQSGVRSGVEYWARLLDGPLSELEDRVRGRDGRLLYEWLAEDEETADIFQEWMVEITGLAGAEIIRKISIPDAETLLDVGGGHGWYSIELCRRNPDLSAVILDHHNATRQTDERIMEAGLGDRVNVVNDDYMTYQSDSHFDIALMFNILHGHKTDVMNQLVERSTTWLSPRGRLLIVEQFPVRWGMSQASSALLGLVFDQVLDGQAHSYRAVEGSLIAAGYTQIKRRDLKRAPGTSLIEARRGR